MAVAGIVLCACQGLQAQVLCPATEQNVLAPPETAETGFGYSMDLSPDGNVMVIGAPQYRIGATGSVGAAYVFVRGASGWNFVQKLELAEPAADDWFGTSVCVSNQGEIIAVGCFNDEVGSHVDAGSAFLYERRGDRWELLERLESAAPQQRGKFGRSASISDNGNVLVIGSQAGFNFDGAVDTFFRENGTWTRGPMLSPSTGVAFGTDCAVSGDGRVLLVGDPNFERSQPIAGRGNARVYDLVSNQWTPRYSIRLADSSATAAFGSSCAISYDGSFACIGARLQTNEIGVSCGAAYVFSLGPTAWERKATLMASTQQAADWFGSSVDISGEADSVVVGAAGSDVGSADTGAAFVYRRAADTWALAATIVDPNAIIFDGVGTSVSVSHDGERVFTSATGTYNEGAGVGSVLVVNIQSPSGCDLNQDGIADGADLLELADRVSSGGGYCTDINNDGGADIADIIELAGLLSSGTCP